MKKINELTSTNVVQQNIEKLKELFPTAVSEDKLVIEELQALMGEYIEKEKEYYQMTWAGKTEAQKEANKVSTGTLRPVKEESKDWDTTGNIVIEGENLEVLKLLQKTYSNKIKMIYIDPPYNTGNDFVYKDNYKDNLAHYLELTGQTDEEGKKLSSNTESDGRYHSNWLNMMYPRLKLARNLLTDDGVIFISIDDNEQANLKKMCDEIFGEENFIANMIRENKAGAGHDSGSIAIEYDYTMMYCKDKSALKLNKKRMDVENDPKYRLADEYVKERGKYYLRDLDYRGTYAQSGDYEITFPSGRKFFPGGKFGPPNTWRWSKEKVKWGRENGYIVFNEDRNKVYIKQYQYVDNEGNYYVREIPYRALTKFMNGQGSKEVGELIGSRVFSFPKSVEMLRYYLKIASNKKNSIVLDFFSGSGTTAHAVMKLNAEDGGNRKCISIQLPEPTDEKSEAYNADYSNIAEITKERIRRAGELIKEEHKDKEGIENLDVGFRVFKLDSSNIKAWDTSVEKFEEQLDMFSDNDGENIKSSRTEEDILFEILLKYGLELTVPIIDKQITGNKVYNIGFGSMYICLEDKVNPDVAKGIGEWHKEEFTDSNPSVIFKDTGFDNDADKTNTVQTLKQFGISNVKSI